MKKLGFVLLVVVSFACLISCGNKSANSGDADSKEYVGKIAVIRNMASSDHTAQFFAGCTEEGNALGYEVDTFMSDGDDVKMQDLVEQAMQKDYDIFILSHANDGYQYELVSKAVEKGIKVVGFDCGGEHVDGVTYTSQNDVSLAQISLDALIEKAKENGATEPVKIIELNTLGAIVPFDTRHSVIEDYIAEGKLESVTIVSPSLVGGDFYQEPYTGISTTLGQKPVGEVDGIWTASSAFLPGIMDAVKDAKREELVVTAIDISDTEVQRLYEEPQYYCCAAVDPYIIGVADVRIAVLKTMGVETEETVQFPAVGVYGEVLAEGDTMKSLSKYFDNFGSTDLFNTEEIVARKEEIAQ